MGNETKKTDKASPSDKIRDINEKQVSDKDAQSVKGGAISDVKGGKKK